MGKKTAIAIPKICKANMPSLYVNLVAGAPGYGGYTGTKKEYNAHDANIAPEAMIIYISMSKTMFSSSLVMAMHMLFFDHDCVFP